MKRFLKKNALTIPFYGLLIIGLLGLLSLAIPDEEPAKPAEPAVAYAAVATPLDQEIAEYVEEPEEPKEMTAEQMIMTECLRQGIPYEIPVAIARLETGHYTSRAFKEGNNVGGLSRNEVPMSYETLEAGVEAFVNCLATYYFGQGLDTVEEIGRKYCPVNEANWVRTVNQLVRELDV